MRYTEFSQWLEDWPTPSGGIMTLSNIKFYVNAISNIEKAENIDIDKEFQNDGMASISKLYSYSKQDKETNRPNPTKVALTKPTVYSTLSDHKTALNHYVRFCKKNPPK